jgi:hypothetical protein
VVYVRRYTNGFSLHLYKTLSAKKRGPNNQKVSCLMVKGPPRFLCLLWDMLGAGFILKVLSLIWKIRIE